MIMISAHCRISVVMEVRKRGRLKYSIGFRGIFSVVFGNLLRRKVVAKVIVMTDPIM